MLGLELHFVYLCQEENNNTLMCEILIILVFASKGT